MTAAVLRALVATGLGLAMLGVLVSVTLVAVVVLRWIGWPAA